MTLQPKTASVVRFGDYTLDLRTCELCRRETPLKLQPQPAKVLTLLVSRAGELITRQELAEQVWGSDTFVDFEQGLNYAIRQIRSVLDDDADRPCFLETVPKRGYRFIAGVEDANHATAETGAVSGDRPLLETPERKWQSPGRRMKITLACVALALITLVVGYLIYRRSASTVDTQAIQSIAVLPLENLSREPEQEYFADGLTDALITDLGKVANLRVISRTSVLPYKSQRKPLPEIAHELNVDAIVEGTVLMSGDRIRVTAQLVKTSPERHLWAERYERNTGELIALEQQLAVAIAHEISGRVVDSARWSAGTTNERAYEAYLRGRYLWNQRTNESGLEARGYFKQALHDDPNFALAWSGLSDTYSMVWGSKPDLALAEEYACKAIALVPDLAEAHVSLAIVYRRQFKIAESIAEATRALELNPNSVMAHHWLAINLLSIGKPAEALAENDRALQSDPFSLPVNVFRGAILLGLRQYDQAVEQFFTAAAISPKSTAPHTTLARVYWILEQPSKALDEQYHAVVLEHSPELVHDQQEVTAVLQSTGRDAARRRVAELQADRVQRQDPPDWVDDIPYHYAALREKSLALYWIREGVRAHDFNLSVLATTAPEFDWLQSDTEFQQLLKEFGVVP